MADFCSKEFGFTRLQASTSLSDKMQAHLLLSDAPSIEVDRWASILSATRATDTALKDEHYISRLGEIAEAAARDPSIYTQAEAKYVELLLQPTREALSGCKQATADSFVSENLLSGEGDVERYKPSARSTFAKSVQELKSYIAELGSHPAGVGRRTSEGRATSRTRR